MKYHDPQTGADAELFDDGTLFVNGTWGKTDVIQDLKAWPTILQTVKGHRGAYEQARFLLNELGRDWEKVINIQGHSLGGSVALWLGLWAQLEVTTYGAFRPFVFWWKIDNPLEAINYIYGWDIVPRLFWWRKYYGKVVRIKGKVFHPFRDHLEYDLSKYGVRLK